MRKIKVKMTRYRVILSCLLGAIKPMKALITRYVNKLFRLGVVIIVRTLLIASFLSKLAGRSVMLRLLMEVKQIVCIGRLSSVMGKISVESSRT